MIVTTKINNKITAIRPSRLESVNKLVKPELDAVNDITLSQLNNTIDLIHDVGEHIIKSGGKRIRPLIVLLSAKACGYEGDDHIHLAASIEYFHTSTLLHDDVVDESTLRRGVLTANHIWGAKSSILVGDFLFSRAFELMVQTKNHSVLSLLAKTANKITQGELKQLSYCGNPNITEDHYFDVIKSKTATLFQAAAKIGPLLAHLGIDIQSALDGYGLNLGFAYQLIDDALDYCGSVENSGKNIGDDLSEGKLTLPLIYILQKGTEGQKQLVIDAIANKKTTYLDDILKAIVDTDAIEFTKSQADIKINEAIKSLAPLPDSPYKKALADIAYFTSERAY